MADKIKLEFVPGSGTKVFIDDKELHGVTAIEFTQSVDTMPVAKITMWSRKIEVDTEGIVELNVREETKN